MNSIGPLLVFFALAGFCYGLLRIAVWAAMPRASEE